MTHLDRIGSKVSVSISPDDEGLLGRECPETGCEKYFKIQPGTGLSGENLPCYCPYCGHVAGHNMFFTKDQVEYAKSVALNKVTGAILKDLKSLEFNHKPRGDFGIGISMKVTGKTSSIRHYCESDLETEVVCDKCTLRYMIYGVFGFCPDCGIHNSLQILEKNFSIIEKALISKSQDPDVYQQSIENALEDCISIFDGFGREICRVFSSKITEYEATTKIRFKNITKARKQILEKLGIDIVESLSDVDWICIEKAIQKRHLISHKMGVIDAAYQRATGELPSFIGRRVTVKPEEIHNLLRCLRALGHGLYQALSV